MPRKGWIFLTPYSNGDTTESRDNQGELFMTPSPISKYQKILRKIVFILERIITENDLGEVFYAPCDIYLER